MKIHQFLCAQSKAQSSLFHEKSYVKQVPYLYVEFAYRLSPVRGTIIAHSLAASKSYPDYATGLVNASLLTDR